MGHVHPDLVRAPGLEPALDQRRARAGGIAEALEQPRPRHRPPAAVRDHGHADPVGRMPADARLRC
jgi:hypothetical protein